MIRHELSARLRGSVPFLSDMPARQIEPVLHPLQTADHPRAGRLQSIQNVVCDTLSVLFHSALPLWILWRVVLFVAVLQRPGLLRI